MEPKMRLAAKTAPALLAIVLALSGCETAEERAEGHYQRALALVAEGETERAEVEFRNVFRLDGNHSEARLAYAGILEEKGDAAGALGQYLRLVEQDPTHLEGRRATARLALALGDVETARTNVDAAFAEDPADTQIRAIKAAVDYAREGGDRPAAVAMAREVLAEDPSQITAHMILIAEAMNAGDHAGALPLIDAAAARAPEDEALAILRLSALQNLGDPQAEGAQLRAMVDAFPANDSFWQALVRWHVARDDPDGAEAVLREMAALAPDDPEARYRVVQFLLNARGPDAARAELETLRAEAADPAPFQRALAVLDFAEGDRDAAIASMRALIDAAEPSDDRRETQIALARMLDDTGDSAGRDAMVDAVLAEDAGQIEALKMRARREIDADRPENAVRDMRDALEQAPRDPAILTLMAEAHLREGARELAGERLALAVEVSGRGSAESVRYARFLLEDGRVGPAESVLLDGLKAAPNDIGLLSLLGELHLERRDWARATQVAGLLRERGDPEAVRAADAIEATALRSQNRLEETADMLRGLVEADAGDTRALAGLVQTWVEAGEIDQALTFVNGRLAQDPESVPLRMMLAGLNTVGDAPDEAEALYRAIIAENPAYTQPYQALFALLNIQGRPDDAEAVLDAGIAASPEDPRLLFTKASLLEGREDFEGAIAIYEAMYARGSDSELIANNLASLVAAHRPEAELEKAYTIARRLRASNVPHYQDTYGWILARRGDPAQALTYLEPAARGLPENAIVQAHLGLTYADLESWDLARAALERAIELAGPDSGLPQIADARARLEGLAEAEAAASAPAPAATQ
jgi:predicted Zn-dependent protease